MHSKYLDSMKKIIAVLAFSILVVSCSSNKEENMTVQGTIKGLKKGTLYLQKMQDTVLVSVDSISLLGTDTFILKDHIGSPEMYYLTFDGNTTNRRILFFGEEGSITINDKLEGFGFNPEILGSKNQDILNKFATYIKRFQNDRLDYIKKDFEARKDNNDSLIQQLELEYQKMQKRRVLFTTNFAISNSDYEASPYIGLTEMYDASLKMLDTVNNSMTEKVKKSFYGKRFQNYVSELKVKEKK